MPTEIWPYVTVLLYYTGFWNCKSMGEVLETVGHDRLTRMLNGDWSGHILLDWSLRIVFCVAFCFIGGNLLLDDTIVEKPYSSSLHEAAWTYSHTHKKVVFGVPIVLLVWQTDTFRIPLAFRLWKKGGVSKIDLALELLSYARNKLHIKPDYVLFDSWYPAQRLLRRIVMYGWYFATQLKKNRKFNGVSLKKQRWSPYYNAIGELSGGIRVLVVRHRKKFYATNRLSLPPKELRVVYKKRQGVEEVIKFLKSVLGLQRCQSGHTRYDWQYEGPKPEGPQEHHIALCILAYLILECERLERGTTLRKLRNTLILKRMEVHLPVLSKLMSAA